MIIKNYVILKVINNISKKDRMKQFIFLFIFIFFILWILNRYLFRYIDYFENQSDRKWVVLLTTCVAPAVYGNGKIDEQKRNKEINERKELYSKQIQRWLNETPYSIYVVESSGYDFPDIQHDRLKIISFQLNEKLPSSSQYEARSILHALDEMKEEDDIDYVLKVTGRYFLPGIEKSLKNISSDKNSFLQIHRKEGWQNSEYFGLSKDNLYQLAEETKDIGLMEKILFDFTKDKQIEHIGPFSNNIARGGDGIVLKDL